MRASSIACVLALLLPALAHPLWAGGCPPQGFDRAALETLKRSGFELADSARRQKLALALLPCLSDPDPAMRDGITFEAYYTWMRAKLLDVPTRTELLVQLGAMLEAGQADRDGFRQPFAALVLAEVARTDRIEPWLTPAQRAAFIDSAARYVTSVRDYRGFDPKEGWRHGVAHGADLLLQLALNPAVDRAGLDRLLGAVAAQVAPGGEHSYIYGESERLARPVLFAAQRGLHTPDEWNAWLLGVAAPAPFDSWNAAFASSAGLARRHNVHAFIYALYANARASDDPKIQALVPGLQSVLKTL
ncbi:MAG TPA: DUF2785 domain-containing protein [Steroidobacteraceae bacterium]|nr:DUF2785 domain-containing protein [Steroidobacteraceae bacterium]